MHQDYDRASIAFAELEKDPQFDELFAEIAREEIGAALRAARERKRLSQSKVAEHMGVTRSRISQIESTDGPTLNLGVLQRYATALGCVLDVSIREPIETHVATRIVWSSHSAVRSAIVEDGEWDRSPMAFKRALSEEYPAEYGKAA